MSGIQSDLEKEQRTAPLDCLTSIRRRRLLRILFDRRVTTTERELARKLAAMAYRLPHEAVSSEAVDVAHIHLGHVDLPKLDDAGLVTWNEADASVALTDHPALEDPQFELLVEADDDRWVEVVADGRCREILATFESRTGRSTRAELAREVATRETDGEPTTQAVDSVMVQLHHVHLPKLEQAGLVEYDADDGTVTYRGPPDILGAASLENPVFEPGNLNDVRS